LKVGIKNRELRVEDRESKWGVEIEDQNSSVGIEGQNSSVEIEGQNSSVEIEDQNSSVEIEGQNSSVEIEDQNSSVEIEGQNSSVEFQGRIPVIIRSAAGNFAKSVHIAKRTNEIRVSTLEGSLPRISCSPWICVVDMVLAHTSGV